MGPRGHGEGLHVIGVTVAHTQRLQDTLLPRTVPVALGTFVDLAAAEADIQIGCAGYICRVGAGVQPRV